MNKRLSSDEIRL